MPSITSANIGQAIVKVVAAKALPALVGQLGMANLVNRDFEPTISSIGASVNVPIPPDNMQTNNIAETGSVQTQAPNLGNAQITLDKHSETSFFIPDVTKVLTNVDLLDVLMESAIAKFAETIETDLLALATLFAANTPVGAFNTALTEATVDNAETALFTAKVPAGQAKYLIVDPTAYSQLRQITRFSEFRTAGEAGLKALIEGNVGRIKDFFVIRSQFVSKVGSNTTNLAFAKNAIGMAMRRLPEPIPGTGAIATYAEMAGYGFRVLMSYNPNTLGQQVTIDGVWGAGCLRNNQAVQVRS
jgi:hypothetical protein